MPLLSPSRREGRSLATRRMPDLGRRGGLAAASAVSACSRERCPLSTRNWANAFAEGAFAASSTFSRSRSRTDSESTPPWASWSMKRWALMLLIRGC